MRPDALIDLHCDTLTGFRSAAGGPDPLDDPRRAFSLSAVPDGVHWAQWFAVFIPDERRGQAATDWFEQHRRSFGRQMQRCSDRVAPCRSGPEMEAAFARGKTAAFLTVENGSVLAGDLSRVRVLAEAGVCALTLVWNGENEIGSGHSTGRGLSAFGRAVVPELERCGILVDVSHLNDRGFEDLLGVAQRPFLATHSNARAVTGHRRNLTDGMIREMVRRGCLIGLNYFVDFLRDGGKGAGLDDLYRHIVHFLELGAAECLALGSDFDGAELPGCLDSPQKAAEAYGYLLARGIGRRQADGIFYQNARRFLAEHLAQPPAVR